MSCHSDNFTPSMAFPRVPNRTPATCEEKRTSSCQQKRSTGAHIETNSSIVRGFLISVKDNGFLSTVGFGFN